MAARTICIWGKNNCGKTALAMNLAAYLAQNQMLVGLISATDYAEIPTYLDLTFPANKGLKAAKEAPSDHIKNFYVEASQSSSLYLLSAAPDCDSFDVAGFDKAMGRRIIQESKEVFDVLIIDATTTKENAITGEALALSDAVVIPVNDDLAYPQWHQSNIRLFELLKIKTYYVESMFNGHANMQTILRTMGVNNAVAAIQYIKNAPGIINEGGFLFKGGREQKIYEVGLSQLWEAIKRGG